MKNTIAGLLSSRSGVRIPAGAPQEIQRLTVYFSISLFLVFTTCLWRSRFFGLLWAVAQNENFLGWTFPWPPEARAQRAMEAVSCHDTWESLSRKLRTKIRLNLILARLLLCTFFRGFFHHKIKALRRQFEVARGEPFCWPAQRGERPGRGRQKLRISSSGDLMFLPLLQV